MKLVTVIPFAIIVFIVSHVSGSRMMTRSVLQPTTSQLRSTLPSIQSLYSAMDSDAIDDDDDASDQLALLEIDIDSTDQGNHRVSMNIQPLNSADLTVPQFRDQRNPSLITLQDVAEAIMAVSAKSYDLVDSDNEEGEEDSCEGPAVYYDASTVILGNQSNVLAGSLMNPTLPSSTISMTSPHEKMQSTSASVLLILLILFVLVSIAGMMILAYRLFVDSHRRPSRRFSSDSRNPPPYDARHLDLSPDMVDVPKGRADAATSWRRDPLFEMPQESSRHFPARPNNVMANSPAFEDQRLQASPPSAGSTSSSSLP